jgi:fibronectin-binding autotransporter adhesin
MKFKTQSNPFLRNLASAAFTFVLAGYCPSVHAADYTWDADTVTTGAQSGSGTWNTTTAIWWNGTADVVWGAANAAIFAGDDATVGTFHDITLGENLTGQKLTFNNSGYRLGAAGALTLSLTNVGDGVITVAPGKSATIGNDATIEFTLASNTGARSALNNGTLEIAAGGTLTRTGQVTTGFTSTGGSLGFTGAGGTLNVSGTLSYNVPTPIACGGIVISNTTGNSVTLNVNNGGVVSSNSTINGIAVVSGNSGVRSGILTVSAGGLVSTTGTAFVTSGINLANGVDSSGTVNLNGGIISTYKINSNYMTSSNVVSTGGTGTFNFNGGTLKAIANNASFLTGLTGATVTVNTNSFIDNGGFNIGIGQSMGGAAGISFQGNGTTTLSGDQTYAGPTDVTAGTLNLQTTSLASDINVSAGATLVGTTTAFSSGSITVANSGSLSVKAATVYSTQLTNSGSLNLGSGGTTNLTFDFNSLDTAAPFVATENLAVNGPINLSFPNGANLTTGQHPLISYTSFSGTAPTGTVSFGVRSIGTLINDTANGVLYLDINADSPRWTGRDNGNWVTGATGANSNWELIESGTATNYIEGDAVLFDENAIGTKDIIIATNVSPQSTTFDNNTAYTVSGPAGIATGSLTKNGGGDVTISSVNTFPGGTTINDGSITAGNSAALGSGSVTLNGGSLNLNGQTIANAITLSAGDVLGNGTLSGVISGSGTLNQSAGTLILTGTNTYTGSTFVTGGTLQIGDGTTDGSIAASSGIINDGSLVYNLVGARTYAKPISGTGSLTKQGAGTLTLSNTTSSFTGGTTVSEGTLVANATALSSGNISVASIATLTSSGGTISGTVTGPGNVTSSGNTVITGDFSSFSGTYTHNTTLFSTNFNTAAATSKNAAYHIATIQDLSQGIIAAGNGDYTLEIGALSGVANSLFRGSNLATGLTTLQIGNLGTDTTFAGSINNGATKSLALTKVGGGKLNLSGTNNYSGTTTVTGGVLAVNGNALADSNKLVIDGGKIEPTGTEVVGTLYFGATQAASGTWGANGSGATHIDDVHFTGTGKVQVTTGPVGSYSSWATLNGASAVASEDHDNDGVPNGVEFFLGGASGNTTGFTALPGVTTAAGGRSVTWTHAADYTGGYGVDFVIETSTTLATGSWTTETAGGDVTLTGNDVKYVFPTVPAKKFVRLRVTAN